MDIFIKFRSDENITKKSVYDIISIIFCFFQIRNKIEIICDTKNLRKIIL